MSDPFLTEVRWTGAALRVLGWLSRDTPGDPAPELLLREREGGRVYAVPAATDVAGALGRTLFAAEADLNTVADGKPLPHGLWDVELTVAGRGVPLGRDRDPGLDSSPQRHFLPDSTMVSAYFSVHGTLAVDVGGEPHAAGSTPADTLAWNDHDEELVVSGHVDFRDISMPISGTLTLRERGGVRVYEVIAMLDAEPSRLGYTAAVPMTRAFIDDPLPRGTWDAYLILGFSGMHRELQVLAPADPVELQVRRRLRPVRVGSTRAPEPLAITVGRA